MNIQSVVIPERSPATFYDWGKKHFHNPNNESIKEVKFEERKQAPRLRLKMQNYQFDKDFLRKKKAHRLAMAAVKKVSDAFRGVEIAIGAFVKNSNFVELSKKMGWR